jgi:hypothetical protein
MSLANTWSASAHLNGKHHLTVDRNRTGAFASAAAALRATKGA